MGTDFSVGSKFGCFTIIGGTEFFQEEVAAEQIRDLEEQKQAFLCGEKCSKHNITSEDAFNRIIDMVKNSERYKCQCKCGAVYYLDTEFLQRKRWRDCGEECGLKVAREAAFIATLPRKPGANYDVDFAGTTFETLEVLECVDDRLEGKPHIYDKRKKGSGVVYLYKVYKCRCYLCGKEHLVNSSDFYIRSDDYGPRASWGYYGGVSCDCHAISSFQWRTIDILKKHNVLHRAEYEFPDLYGVQGVRKLRFDFALFDPEDKTRITCLIECQGEQHYKPINGYSRLNTQKQNDDRKREYAKSHGIPLVEIPYTCNTYDKEVAYLKKCGIICPEE